ncbi:MAG: aminodeoxychorismate/anthranilate synthase component II [Planctomycetaceae bacterium]|nr:aminodeoxychorismate/anthranilate synthase component II [Planctomycetaceae bacterium]MCB9952289.1 aminodeoxychorismate/anthranilate synthase component II [Planctomycetaceae bacterium]
MIFILDNYDSFTYNLVQRLGEIDPTLNIEVRRNDQTSVDEIRDMNPAGIIISPGPCTPNEAGLSCDVIRELGVTIPLLGVCLGHQCIGQTFGAKVVRADRLMHGKVSEIHHDQMGVFAGLPSPFQATRYHSLIVPEDTLPAELIPTAWTRDSDHPAELMALQHRDYPIHGVQFHPESFLSHVGTDLLKNFLGLCRETVG